MPGFVQRVLSHLGYNQAGRPMPGRECCGVQLEEDPDSLDSPQGCLQALVQCEPGDTKLCLLPSSAHVGQNTLRIHVHTRDPLLRLAPPRIPRTYPDEVPMPPPSAPPPPPPSQQAPSVPKAPIAPTQPQQQPDARSAPPSIVRDSAAAAAAAAAKAWQQVGRRGGQQAQAARQQSAASRREDDTATPLAPCSDRVY
jgi:hypothetical protein